MKAKRNLVPPAEILAWLQTNYPDLHKVAELDRNWVWLPVDLRGDHNAAIRKAIGPSGYGFRWAKRGHALPSGREGTWAHCGVRPTPFIRRGGGQKQEDGKPAPAARPGLDDEIAQILAMAGGGR